MVSQVHIDTVHETYLPPKLVTLNKMLVVKDQLRDVQQVFVTGLVPLCLVYRDFSCRPRVISLCIRDKTFALPQTMHNYT